MIEATELQNYRIVSFDGKKCNFLKSDAKAIAREPFLINALSSSHDSENLTLSFDEIPFDSLPIKKTTVIYSCAFANSTLVANVLSHNKDKNNVEVLSEPLIRLNYAYFKGRDEYLNSLEQFSKLESLSPNQTDHIIIKSQPKFWGDSLYNNCERKIFLRKNVEDLAISFVKRSNYKKFFLEYIDGLIAILKDKREKYKKLYKVFDVKELSGLILDQYEVIMKKAATDIIDVNNVSKDYRSIIENVIGSSALNSIDQTIDDVLYFYPKDTSRTIDQVEKANSQFVDNFKAKSKVVLDYYHSFKEKKHRLSNEFEEYSSLL